MQAGWKDYLHLHLIVFIWGFTAILGALISLPSPELVFWRTLLAAAGMLCYMCLKQMPLYVPWPALLKILFTGLLIAAHWILFFASTKLANVSVCLVGMASVTLWTGLLEPLIRRKPFRSLDIAVGLIVLAGLYIIFYADFSYALGLLLAVVSALLGAIFSILNAELVRQHHPYTITLYEMLGAWLSSLLFLPFYKLWLATGGQLQLIPNATDWLYLILLSGVCTVYAFSASVKLMRKFTAFVVNLTVNLEPVYGILLAFWLLGEAQHLSLAFFIGGGIVLASVLLYPFLYHVLYRKQHQSVPVVSASD